MNFQDERVTGKWQCSSIITFVYGLKCNQTGQIQFLFWAEEEMVYKYCGLSPARALASLFPTPFHHQSEILSRRSAGNLLLINFSSSSSNERTLLKLHINKPGKIFAVVQKAGDKKAHEPQQFLYMYVLKSNKI